LASVRGVTAAEQARGDRDSEQVSTASGGAHYQVYQAVMFKPLKQSSHTTETTG
jgi:hypothetical protein